MTHSVFWNLTSAFLSYSILHYVLIILSLHLKGPGSGSVLGGGEHVADILETSLVVTARENGDAPGTS